MWVGSLGWEIPGGGHGLLQYSCQENSMDKGALRAMVHRISKSPESTEMTACMHKDTVWALIQNGWSSYNVVIAAVVILAAALIPTLVILNNKTNDSAALQEQTNQQLADLVNKVNNKESGVTAAEFEAKLAELKEKGII